jgi:hypothetical protein
MRLAAVPKGLGLGAPRLLRRDSPLRVYKAHQILQGKGLLLQIKSASTSMYHPGGGRRGAGGVERQLAACHDL